MKAGTVCTEPDFTEIHDELRAVTRDVLATVGPGERIDSRVLAAQGWLGLEVPEEFDGAGATYAEVAIVLEELGRAVVSSGYLGAALAAGVCGLLAPAPARDALLSVMAAGTAMATVAFTANPDDCDATPPFRIDRGAGGQTICGCAEFVPDAVGADRLLLLAADPDGVPVIVAVAADTTGLVCSGRAMLDETRSFGTVTVDAIAVPDDAVWHFDGDPSTAIRRLHDRAAVAIACDSLGLSEAMLAATVAYVRTRTQFGRSIGSFQAVKHACADMLVQITVARQLVDAAVRQLAAADQSQLDTAAVRQNDPVGLDVTTAAAMAKSYTCTAAVEITGKAMQLHGGYGYTWESGIHRYLKRATFNRALFGSPAALRRHIAARYR
ncbi:acyl-CoA/acyl-ACP dehydrogenase [Nocardia vinacea]|uniref:acyl-CoA dehydrogenase family protein n=1 Tax=Nocardia vinacea TaxID=96468 RepID=UPI002E140F04|nr:acyl-CoA/acyl-ACP dehydrogenase [Nocardia vinacea]